MLAYNPDKVRHLARIATNQGLQGARLAGDETFVQGLIGPLFVHNVSPRVSTRPASLPGYIQRVRTGGLFGDGHCDQVTKSLYKKIRPIAASSYNSLRRMTSSHDAWGKRGEYSAAQPVSYEAVPHNPFGLRGRGKNCHFIIAQHRADEDTVR